jgi:hypothetical protein
MAPMSELELAKHLRILGAEAYWRSVGRQPDNLPTWEESNEEVRQAYMAIAREVIKLNREGVI